MRQKKLSDLINELPEKDLKAILLKYAKKHDDLRSELLASPHMRGEGYNELAKKEWSRRMDLAIKKDKKDADFDKYYGNVFLTWKQTEKDLELAVEDLGMRGLQQDALDLIDAVQQKVEAVDEEDFERRGYSVYLEQDGCDPEFFEKLRGKSAQGDEGLNRSFFDIYEEKALEGELSPVWLEEFTMPEQKKRQLAAIMARLDIDPTEKYACAAFDLIAELDEGRLKDFFEEFQHMPAIRLRMQEYLRAAGNSSLEVELLEEDLLRNPNDEGKSARLLEILMAEGDVERAKAEYARRIGEGIKIDADFILEYCRLLPQAEAVKVLKEVARGAKYDDKLRMWAYRTLKDAEGLKKFIARKAARIFVGRHGGGELLTAYLMPNDEFLSETDPEFVPNVIFDFLDREGSFEPTENAYGVIAGFLDYLLEYPERDEMVREFAEYFKKKFGSSTI